MRSTEWIARLLDVTVELAHYMSFKVVDFTAVVACLSTTAESK